LTRGEDPWPFQIVVQNGQGICRSYNPKNDLTVLAFSLPRLLLEVNSTQLGQVPYNQYQMLLQATSIIKFANTFLDKYKSNKNFILIAIYISNDGKAERYIMYQDMTVDPDLEDVPRIPYQFSQVLTLFSSLIGILQEKYFQVARAGRPHSFPA